LIGLGPSGALTGLRYLYREARYSCDTDIAFADVDPSEYVALVISAGRAGEYIRNTWTASGSSVTSSSGRSLGTTLSRAARADGSRCANGEADAVYPALESDIKAVGAEFVNAKSVVDGMIDLG
jgi:protease I